MSSGRDEGPVYYREIQKNAYLKRIPNEVGGGMLRPLGHKKPPLKPLWTLFCVHNGRTPFLEQYPEPESPATQTHKPVWRACLKTARHVTASVKPHVGDEYDFLVDTDHGPVRMLAPDWAAMQDWVTTLRSKLHELKILSKGENVYCAPPAAPPPRAAARDPTSPLPPTPPVPPDRVPGIELTTPIPRTQPPETTPQPENSSIDISNWDTPFNSLPSTSVTSAVTSIPSTSNVTSIPSTSQEENKKQEPKKSVAKICGQNICLDDSILKRRENTGSTDSDEEFFAEIDRISDSVENLNLDTNITTSEQWIDEMTNEQRNEIQRNQIQSNGTQRSQIPSSEIQRSQTQSNELQREPRNGQIRRHELKRSGQRDQQRSEIQRSEIQSSEIQSSERNESKTEYKQTLLVNDKPGLARALSETGGNGENKKTNITVIQVSNKPPHTAIPVLGSETDIFDFTFQQNLSVNNDSSAVTKNETVKVPVKSDRSNVTKNDAVKVPVNNDSSNVTKNDTVKLPVNSDRSNVTKNETVKVPVSSDSEFVNIVNTEVNVTENGYGTVFDKESDYGHLSLTTTVKLTGQERIDSQPVSLTCQPVIRRPVDSQPLSLIGQTCDLIQNVNLINQVSSQHVSLLQPVDSTIQTVNSSVENEGIYERLCLASTSINNQSNNPSPLPIRKIKHSDKHRKSSLPNLDSSTESAYEYLFPNTREVTVTSDTRTNDRLIKTDIRNRLKDVPTSVSERRNENLRTRIQNSNATVNLNAAVNVTSAVNVTAVSLTNTQVNVSNCDRRNVERSHSQNAYDSLRNGLIRRQHCSPKRDGKNEKTEPPAKPIWKRGLTELSLLSRLRGIGQGKRQESPNRQDSDHDRAVTSPGKVVHRSRPEGRTDNTRRRSSSLSNGQSPTLAPAPSLQPLRARQAAGLRAEQRRGAAVPATLPVRDPPVFISYDRQVWIAWWSCGANRFNGRAGDRVAAVRGTLPRDANHARQLVKSANTHIVDILFHRVPLGKIYVLNKRDLERIGIKLDSECNIISVEAQSPAAKAGIPPPGKWAVTEVNNRPINLIKGGEEDMNRLSVHGSEVSVLIQPSALVKKIRAAIKANKAILSIR